jgi:hypothetical protein
MRIELSNEDITILRDLLRQKILELDTEINRTDSLDFKRQLQQLDRGMERVLGQLTAALEHR